MAWYWWLVIAIAIVLVIVLIGIFGTDKVKKLAYELVCNAENLLGSGYGQEKYNLVLDNLEKLTKGIIPKSLMKKAIEWGVNRMKNMLLENKDSIEKHNKEDKENGK